jgi:transcription termination factor Rho
MEDSLDTQITMESVDIVEKNNTQKKVSKRKPKSKENIVNEDIFNTSGDALSDDTESKSENNVHESNNIKNEEQNDSHDLRPLEMEIHYPYPITSDVILAKSIRAKSFNNLIEEAKKFGVQNYLRLTKQEIIYNIISNACNSNNLVYSEGVLDLSEDGHGFLRSQDENYKPSQDDVFISQNQIKRFGLRCGDLVGGYIKNHGKRVGGNFLMINLKEINGVFVDSSYQKINFDNLTPLYPNRKINLHLDKSRKGAMSTRMIDLVSPIGFGQRALIVAPPRTGKTVLMQNIADAISTNHPDAYLIYLGIDERPEEFTEMKRTIKGEVVSSTFDEPATRHVALAQIVIEKAKRLVEKGLDVVILLDSITRLARAYNTVSPSSGKILSGGVDSNALHKPKRFFGAARNIEDGGSLTIIATALVDTGSRMDEVIFEEFKGTGNCEIILDRKIADKRIFPAIDILKSGTRKEEEMVPSDILSMLWMLRRVMTADNNSIDAIEFLLEKLSPTADNEEFLRKMNN